MSRLKSLTLLLALLALAGGTSGKAVEKMEIDPLADKDLYHFKQEGGKAWKIDDKSHDVDTLIVHPRAKDDTSLVFVRRTFRQGFRVSMKVMGGPKHKGFEFYIVPPKGERILVPVPKRWISKRDWHDYIVTVEKGKAWAMVRVDRDGEEYEKTERVAVPEGEELSFAIKLLKRSEAKIRKVNIKFLVVTENQMKPEANFVRIFDGTSKEGWTMGPEGFEDVWKFGNQKIKGHFTKRDARHYAELVFTDVAFDEYVFRFKASADSRGLRLMAGPNEIPGIDDYFQRDRDWNEVEWEVKAQKATLKINGNPVMNKSVPPGTRVNPRFFLYPGGKCTLRDVRVSGRPVGTGKTWMKYLGDSGMVGIGGGGGDTGGAGAGGDTSGAERGPADRVLFDGKNLEDWNLQPADVWSVDNGELIGVSFDKTTDSVIYYKKLVFTDYRLLFKVRRETNGAKFMARATLKADGEKPPVFVDIKKEWLSDGEWTQFVAEVYEGNLIIKAGGKQVHRGSVPKQRGCLGFAIKPDSGIALKEIVWQRPK